MVIFPMSVFIVVNKKMIMKKGNPSEDYLMVTMRVINEINCVIYSETE